MRMLLSLAVAVAACIPATAVQAGETFSFSGETQLVNSNRVGVRVSTGDGRWRDGHRRGRRNDTVVVGDVGYYGGEWALYNNRSFESDSYNDWWHDRPERAYPRWMTQNHDCARQYWTGSGWRC